MNDQEAFVAEEDTNNRSLAQSSNKGFLYLAILVAVNLLNYVDRFTVAGTLIDIQSYYKISDADGGLIVTVFICFYMVASPLFGFFGDRYNRKYIICTGLSIWILAVLLSSDCESFYGFLFLRALVGIGEAAYSTVAPTIISDLFTGAARSRCLMIFYAASPVGSGLGYIIGSAVSYWSSWQWGIRVTPLIGITLFVIIVYFFEDVERGQAEHAHVRLTSYYEDVLSLCKIRTYVFTTLGFTCVTFVLGSVSWWTPTFVGYAWGVINGNIGVPPTIRTSISITFGILSCISGIFGVVFGSTLSRILKNGLWNLPAPFESFNFEGKGKIVDPLICSFGSLFGVLAMWAALFTIDKIMIFGWICIFISTVLLCLGFAITTDVILYVTPPTRRSTAIAIQTLFAHLFGDAASPYIIGLLSDIYRHGAQNSTEHFIALQYAFFLPNVILVLGALFYIQASKFIVKDSDNNELIMHMDPPTILDEDGGEFGPSVFGRS